ncbi:MAG: DMT family transporter [Thermodesulfobacteriota bacterium]
MKRNRMKSHNNTGIPAPFAGAAFAFLAAVIFSFLNLAIRFSEPHLTVWHMIFGRSVFGVIFLLAAARIGNIRLSGNNPRTLAALGISGTIGIVGLTVALLHVPLFQALILFYTYPAVAALVSPLLTDDRIRFSDWVCIVLAFSGTFLILWSGNRIGISLSLGHAAALGASAALGVTLTLIRRISADHNALTPIFYISVAGTLISFFPLLFSDSGIPASAAGFWWICAIGILGVSAHISTNTALSYITSPKVGIIGMLEVFFGAVYGYLLFAETLGWSTLFGGTLIIAAAVGLVGSSAPQKN